MSLESRISEMSDTGQFENLATEILRESDHKYESVIQTGVNLEGKPIPDPVDGLGRVPDTDPPHYVFLEFTTRQKSGLERKWLASPDGNGEKGDLIKAVEQADKIREVNPAAEFTAVLVSNRVIESEFVGDVWGIADNFDISIDIWDVHRLSDFLQTNPDGQYIRKKYFGIQEERLSEPLLLELSEKSLRHYRENFHIPVVGAMVERPELATILDRAHNSGARSYFMPIVGDSGFGKTVTCYQAMSQWLEEEKPALRLDSDDIENSKGLSQAVQSGLDGLHPSLGTSAGRTALQIARDNNHLLIVVDDLNRANNPSRLLSQVQNWMGGVEKETGEGKQNGTASNSGGIPITILCPLWPRIWGQEERNINYNRFAEPIELGPLSAELAVRLIQSHADAIGRDVSNDRARTLAENVGRDPHLIGLLGQLIQANEPLKDLPDTSKNVLKKYTEYAYETASDASDESLIIPDYERAVEELSIDVLEHRSMSPAWRQIHKWSRSDPDKLDAIRELTKQAQILRILEQRSERILTFRHDRIRDFSLANSTIDKIRRTDEIPEFLSDPYYHSILGTGIAYFRPSEPTLSTLCDNNPLALLEALQKLNGEAPEYENEIGKTIQEWINQEGGYDELPNSLLGKAMDLLRETDSDTVLDISKSLPQLPPVFLARFRNGDLEAGIQFCNGEFGGSPGTNFQQRDLVFEEAKQRWGDKYTEELSDVLSSIDDERVQGALRLAGFFGRPGLVTGLSDCWEDFQDVPELLPAFLWAVTECCIPDNCSLVDQVLNQWASLPIGASIDNESEEITKGDVYSEVKFSLTRNISDEKVQYFINAVEKHPDLEYHLSLILSRMPDPDALETVVRIRAENIQKADGLSPYATYLFDPWRPDNPHGQTLSSNVKVRMNNLWSNKDNSDEVRTSAFVLWARNTHSEDLEELKRASQNDLFTYTAHRYRLELGDETVITSSSLDFEENVGLLEPLSNAWSSEAFELINDLLEQGSPDESGDLFYHIGGLLFRIPSEDVEKLLKNHWEEVNDLPKFFQAALYAATPETRELATSAFEDTDEAGGLLTHVGMNFGFNTYGRSELISREHLISLEPYLEAISDLDLVHIAEKADELGMSDWGTEHIQPLLSKDYRQNHYPTDEDILRELNNLADGEDVRREIQGWMLRFENRASSKSRVFHILEEWLEQDPTVEKYQMVAEVIKKWGTRDELPILENIPLDNGRIQQFYDDAEFGVKVRTL
jgi:hypothetical protein